MEGKKRRGRDWEEGTNIRKGPRKAGEDEVLINHVNKYGPRDWSSIRSKGLLLLRTGKSCRLRWVNKLTSNLKKEERIVIEMQSHIGNKWTTIATHLPGRSNNDVKNFWSSRQKRLTRILQASSLASTSLSSKLRRHRRRTPVMQVQTLSHLKDSRAEEEEESSSRVHSCTLSVDEDPSTSKLLSVDTSFDCLNCNYTDKNPYPDPQPQVLFPQIPLPRLGIPFSPESQDLMARLNEPAFFSLLVPTMGTPSS